MNTRLIMLTIAGFALIGLAIFVASGSSDSNELTSQDNQASQEDVDNQAMTTTATQAEVVTEANCVSEDCLKVDDLEYPVGTLPEPVAQALNSAIDDEYKARATYAAVIEELGSVRPFSMIIRAEEKHISSLKALYDKYGLDIPADPYTNVEVASTKAANCSVGVQAEIDNAGLYRDALLPTVADYPDIVSTFTNLMDASQNNHLPAFEGCAS